MQRLTELRNEIEQRDYMAKVAHINDVWGEDEHALELLTEAAAELEKQASEGEFGPQGLTPSQLLSMAAAFTQEFLEKEAADAEEAEDEVGGSAEAASDEESRDDADEDVSEEDLDKVAATYEAGLYVGDALAAASNLTIEDLDKLAEYGDEAEQEQFAQLLAHVTHELFSEEG